MSARRRMRSLVQNLSLVVGSFLVCFLIIELVLRIEGYNPLRGYSGGRDLILRKSDNAEMVYELTPKAEGIAWGAPVKINSHGFRDREYDPVKPDGVYRIGVIGDSITFGNHLEVDETYPERLEELFDESGFAVEVLNFGVGGYDTGQEVAFVEEIGLDFDLDEVIVGYCMNDAGVVSLNLRYIQRASTYGSPIYNSRVLQFLRLHLDALESKLYTSDILSIGSEKDEGDNVTVDAFVSERMEWIQKYTSGNDNHVVHLAWYASRGRIGKVDHAFDKLKALSNEYRFKVTVLIIPYVSSHVEAHDWAYEIIRHEAEQRGFSVVEVLDRFLEQEISSLQISQTDVIHPNAVGHRLIADELFELFTMDPNRVSLLGADSQQ